jgi:hypothetical protein
MYKKKKLSKIHLVEKKKKKKKKYGQNKYFLKTNKIKILVIFQKF